MLGQIIRPDKIPDSEKIRYYIPTSVYSHTTFLATTFIRDIVNTSPTESMLKSWEPLLKQFHCYKYYDTKPAEPDLPDVLEYIDEWLDHIEPMAKSWARANANGEPYENYRFKNLRELKDEIDRVNAIRKKVVNGAEIYYHAASSYQNVSDLFPVTLLEILAYDEPSGYGVGARRGEPYRIQALQLSEKEVLVPQGYKLIDYFSTDTPYLVKDSVDVDKWNSVLPRWITCRICGKQFAFSKEEESWYKLQGFRLPTKCTRNVADFTACPGQWM